VTTDASNELSKAAFENLTPEKGTANKDPDLEVVYEIPVELSVVAGTTRITIRQLLGLHQGSVVELDSLVGDALDIRVNGTLIAHGEIVIIDDKFGIRLTDVVSAAERIEKLS
jgi:flagellar motor switch protein FliN/FliY